MPRLLWASILALILSGCAGLSYYTQVFGGHFDTLARAQAITELIADPATDPILRARLVTLKEARAFAARELKLPDNDSYTRFAALDRPYALWNVFAAPKLSLELKQWCFPVAGCVGYRGYFSNEAALEAAARLRAAGYDVYVGPVAAYSTLGWFDDPLTSAMLARGETETIALMFHELAHQRLYARDDSAFNESFAMTVEMEGARRWLVGRTGDAAFAEYRDKRVRHDELIALALDYRARLERLYASAEPDDRKLAYKERLLDELRRAAAATGEADGGFGKWFERDFNNAKLASLGLYHRHVRAFERLLSANGGDLEAFYRAAETLAHKTPAERTEALAALPDTGPPLPVP